MAYNNNIPQPTDLISNSQGQILDNFAAIDSGTTGTGIGFSRNHVTMTDATNGGLHNRVDYFAAVSSPTISGFVSSAYPKTIAYTVPAPADYIELFYKNATKDLAITNTSLTTSSGQGMLPGGLQIRCGSGNSGGSTSVSVTYLAFPTAVISVVTVAEGTDTNQSCQPSGKTTTGFTLTTSKTNLSFSWIAIGY